MIQKARGAKVKVDLIENVGTTGNFEVTVGGDLVHSKKTRGDGFINNQAKLDVVLAAIDSKLA